MKNIFEAARSITICACIPRDKKVETYGMRENTYSQKKTREKRDKKKAREKRGTIPDRSGSSKRAHKSVSSRHHASMALTAETVIAVALTAEAVISVDGGTVCGIQLAV